MLTVVGAASLSLCGTSSAQEEVTILTDADAGVRGVCRWDQSEEVCLVPRGGEHEIIDEWSDDPSYLRVHDQNALDVAYLHFDLSGLGPNAEVSEARFQLDAQSNSWGDTSVMVVAIVDEEDDWDLNEIPENEIFGGNAPKLEWSDWEDELDIPDSNRSNPPTPFLDEGPDESDAVRQLVDEFEPILVESTDADTDGTAEDPGNSYGGFAIADGPGTAGSSDSGLNPWPVKNVIDLDVTELIQWKLGQNADYSDFTPSDSELTLMVRTEVPEFGGGNGFARFVAKESPFLGGELDLAPGRLVLDGTNLAVSNPGDCNGDGVLDAADLACVTTIEDRDSVLSSLNTLPGDLDGNGGVEFADFLVLSGAFSATVGSYAEGDIDLDGNVGFPDFLILSANFGKTPAAGAAAASVPEPSGLLLVGLGALWLLGRRHRGR